MTTLSGCAPATLGGGTSLIIAMGCWRSSMWCACLVSSWRSQSQKQQENSLTPTLFCWYLKLSEFHSGQDKQGKSRSSCNLLYLQQQNLTIYSAVSILQRRMHWQHVAPIMLKLLGWYRQEPLRLRWRCVCDWSLGVLLSLRAPTYCCYALMSSGDWECLVFAAGSGPKSTLGILSPW